MRGFESSGLRPGGFDTECRLARDMRGLISLAETREDERILLVTDRDLV
jgi:hypothetical protein